MKLQKFNVTHFKSLTNVKVDLHPNLTVVVGPNSVGKSNFVDFLRFIRDACNENLDHAMVARGGIARVRQQTAGGRPFNIGFDIQMTQEFKDLDAKLATYELEITTVKGGDFKVEKERAVCHELDRHFVASEANSRILRDILAPSSYYRDRRGKVTEIDINPASSADFEYEDQLVLGKFFVEFSSRSARAIDRYFASWRFTTLYPSTLRELKTPDTDNELREDGSNWASIVRAYRKTARGKLVLERINEMMRVVLPDFLDVSISTAGSYLVPKFKFGKSDVIAKESKIQNREFDPVQLSDGTLRIYGILLSLYQLPPPSLLVIEEPEQTVHPGVLGMLAEAFKEVSEQTQIIITTHSPQLVDRFDPEHIRIAVMDNGETNIYPIKKSQHEAVSQGLYGLGDFMAAEGLYPELPT